MKTREEIYNNTFEHIKGLYPDNIKDINGKKNNIVSEFDTALQQTHTPKYLVQQMLDVVNIDSSKKILVICNVEFILELLYRSVLNKNIFFISDNDTKTQLVIKFGINPNNIYDLDYNKKEVNLGTDMMFDVIVANPPYNRGKHLKFLDKSLSVLNVNGEIIFVHPSEWLVQKRNTQTTQKYNDIKNILNTGTTNIKFINNPWKDGGALLFVPLCITYFKNNNVSEITFEDKRTEGYGKIILEPKAEIILNSLNEITIFGDTFLTCSFLRKIFKHTEKNNCKDKPFINNGEYYVNLSRLSGNGSTNIIYYDNIKRKISNMYSLINSTSLDVTNSPQFAKGQRGKKQGNEKIWISFSTEYEAENYLSFLKKSVLFKSYLSIIKIDQNAANNILAWIPWLDWSQQWTDEKLFDFFDLTKDETEEVYKIIKLITIK